MGGGRKTELELSLNEDDYFECYNIADWKLVNTLEDEIDIMPNSTEENEMKSLSAGKIDLENYRERSKRKIESQGGVKKWDIFKETITSKTTE